MRDIDKRKVEGLSGLGWRVPWPFARVARPRGVLGAVIVLVGFLVATGCGDSSPDTTSKGSSGTLATNQAGGAWIKADPNPVPAGKDPGTTTISWNTGNGATGEVYLLGPVQVEKLFTGGRSGSKKAPWIRKGGKYEFLLYAGKDHQTVLARVTVTKE